MSLQALEPWTLVLVQSPSIFSQQSLSGMECKGSCFLGGGHYSNAWDSCSLSPYHTENEAHTKSRDGKNWVLADILQPLIQPAPKLPDRDFLVCEMIHSFIDCAASSWRFYFLWPEPPSGGSRYIAKTPEKPTAS